MELGATVCIPQQPRCEFCPVQKSCRAFSTNSVEDFPPPTRKGKPVLRRFTAALIVDGKGRCLLARRPLEAQWMKGFWELPMREESNHNRHAATSANTTEDGIVMDSLFRSRATHHYQ